MQIGSGRRRGRGRGIAPPAGPPNVGGRVHEDFEAFAHWSGRSGSVEMILTGPERRAWRDRWATFGSGSVVLGSEGGANIGHSRVPSHMVVFLVHLSGAAPIVAGRRLGKGAVAVHGPGSHMFQAVSGPCSWATFAADPRRLARTRAGDGRSGLPTLPDHPVVVPVDAARLREIRGALSAARALLAAESEGRMDSRRGRIVEEALFRAFAGVPTRGSVRRTPAEERHHRILVRAMEWLAGERNEPVATGRLAEACGSGRRTLARVFRRFFRISPARYLRLRRMGQVRAWIRRGEPAPATVTTAALRYGFTEFGRFAVEYRRLFGRSPSAALRARRRG